MDIVKLLRDAVNRHYGKDPCGIMAEAADEIERLRDNMYQAMHHAAEIWKENGQELDDQLGVVALILANGLGIISDAALKEGE